MAETQQRTGTAGRLFRRITLTPTEDFGGKDVELVNGRPYRITVEGELRGIFSHLDRAGLEYLKAAAGTFPHSRLTYELTRTPEGYVDAHIKIR
ncbi:MAG: hypothetical protein AABY16_03465 [Nanoarchaeota archaeon]